MSNAQVVGNRRARIVRSFKAFHQEVPLVAVGTLLSRTGELASFGAETPLRRQTKPPQDRNLGSVLGAERRNRVDDGAIPF